MPGQYQERCGSPARQAAARVFAPATPPAPPPISREPLTWACHGSSCRGRSRWRCSPCRCRSDASSAAAFGRHLAPTRPRGRAGSRSSGHLGSWEHCSGRGRAGARRRGGGRRGGPKNPQTRTPSSESTRHSAFSRQASPCVLVGGPKRLDGPLPSPVSSPVAISSVAFAEIPPKGGRRISRSRSVNGLYPKEFGAKSVSHN